MTWMLIRLVLSLAFVGLILWFAARVAKKRGLGGAGSGLIEVVARQRMGRSSTVNVVRIGDVVLVVGATEEQITLLAEVDVETVEAALAEREPARAHRAPFRPETAEDDEAAEHPQSAVPQSGTPHSGGLHRPAAVRPSSGALAGSVFDRNGWGSFVNQMRERTVRRP
jgi:flagellar protein FliO/FliZ